MSSLGSVLVSMAVLVLTGGYLLILVDSDLHGESTEYLNTRYYVRIIKFGNSKTHQTMCGYRLAMYLEFLEFRPTFFKV